MVCTWNKDNSGLTSLLPITWPRIVQIDAVKNFKVPMRSSCILGIQYGIQSKVYPYNFASIVCNTGIYPDS